MKTGTKFNLIYEQHMALFVLRHHDNPNEEKDEFGSLVVCGNRQSSMHLSKRCNPIFERHVFQAAVAQPNSFRNDTPKTEGGFHSAGSGSQSPQE